MDSQDRDDAAPSQNGSSPEALSCLRLTSNSADETQRLGETLGQVLEAGDLVLLQGTLGAGKTTFTQGLARGMGLATPVTSPSFTLANVYEQPGADLPLFHLDLWRIKSPMEALGIGLNEYLTGEGACVVEWPDVAAEVLPADYLQVAIERVGDARAFTFSPVGARPNRLLRAFRAALSADHPDQGGRHAPGH